MPNLSPYQRTISRFARPQRPQRFTRPGGLTASQKALLPYVKEVEEEKSKKSRRIQPLKMIFDLLQRGQYLTANIAEEITRSIRTDEPLGEAALDVITGAWEGLSGKRKGDWEKIIFGGQAEGGENFKGWVSEEITKTLSKPLIKFKPGEEGQERGIFRPTKMIGLGANILADPTTYLSFGATTAARGAALKYVDDAVKLAIKTRKGTILKLAGKSLPKKLLTGKIDDAVVKTLYKKGGASVAKYLDDVAREASRAALRTPAGVLEKAMGKRVSKYTAKEAKYLTDKFTKLIKTKGVEKATKVAEKSMPKVKELKTLEDLVTNIAGRYKGAGSRTWRFLGKETGVHDPGLITKQWDTMKTAFEKSKPGQMFQDAWWAVMNKGPLGVLRKTFGFRNPYAKMLNVKKRKIDSSYANTSFEEFLKTKQIFSGMDDNLKAKARNLVDEAYQIGPDKTILDLLVDYERRGISPEEAGKLKKWWKGYKEMNDRWMTEEMQGVASGAIQNYDEVINYIPVHFEKNNLFHRGKAMGAAKPSFTMHKGASFAENMDVQVQKMKVLFGEQLEEAARSQGKKVDDYVRNLVENKGLAEVSTDLEEMMLYRALGHSKAMKRIEMVDGFKEFGIPVEEIQAIPDWGLQQIRELGLRQVDDPAFRGMLFDNEVGEIIENAWVASSSKEGANALKNMFGAYTSWWKGMVTLTTGFHLRNWTSNNMTGFLKHGFSWFNMKKWAGATSAGTFYALHPDKYVDMLKDTFKVSDSWITKQLSRIPEGGELTVKELADYARRTGVISHRTKGFDIPSKAEELMKRKTVTAYQKISPLSTQNVYFRGSRAAGDVIENSSRFQSFLMDYSKGIKGGNVDNALEYGMREAKKWFIDYGDMTKFEQDTMKNIVPFYGWLRNNLSNQLSGILLYPDMYALIPKAQRAMTSDEGFDYELQPDWQKQLAMFPVGKDPETGNWILFKPDFPFKDINLIPLSWEPGEFLPRSNVEELKSDIMQSIHPTIKSIIEVLPERGWNFFKRREVKKHETALPLFQYLARKPQALGFLDGMMRMAGFDAGIRVDLDRKSNKVMMDGKAQRLLENNMPALRTAAMIMELGEEGLKMINPDIEDTIERVTGKKDYYEGMEELLQILSQWLGVKLKSFDPEYYETERNWQIMREAENRKQEENRYQPGYAKHRATWEKTQQKRMKKLGL